MVVVKHGSLPPPGKQYKVYLNMDKLKEKWYLRVTHTYPQYNQHFRAGTYQSKQAAMDALESLDPINPKKGRQRKGTVDQYNGQWRVRAKHRGEHMHIGYFKNREEAEEKLNEVIKDTEFLEKRYNSLISKRKRKREGRNMRPTAASFALLRQKLKENDRRHGYRMRPKKETVASVESASENQGHVFETTPTNKPNTSSQIRESVFFSRPAFKPRPNPGPRDRGEDHTAVDQWWLPPEPNPYRQLDVQKGFRARGESQRSSESVCSEKKKVRIQRRCLSCSKTQVTEAYVFGVSDVSPRLVHIQCEACKQEPVDVGWCAPAILQDIKDGEIYKPALPFLCNPRHYKLKAPISHSEFD